MAIINRVTRLFTADIHAVLDRIEEPDLLLRQSIREMELELDQSERRIDALALELEQLASRRQQCEKAGAGIGEQLDVCFDVGETDLARGLIRRRLELNRLVDQLDQRQQALDKGLAQSLAMQQDQRSKLESMRQKAELFVDDSDHPARGLPVASDSRAAGGTEVSDDEVEIAFLAEKRRRAGS
ncbi:MAG: PspA/IM30 family protein [Gammaproteobacteria bacterium]